MILVWIITLILGALIGLFIGTILWGKDETTTSTPVEKHYWETLTCMNCDDEEEYKIPSGTRWEDFARKTTCKECNVPIRPKGWKSRNEIKALYTTELITKERAKK